MFDIESELKRLPNKPGVYIMRDKNNKIIYVGKAIVLKNRVRQYFRKNKKTTRIQNMVSLIDHFEYIVCDNEAEALILECNLIKKNMPKFNVLLKDDKTYPYIKINIQNDYPDLYITRKVLNDGAKYFGPYANAGSAKEMIDFIKARYKIRQCKNFKYKDRPCLNYHIKKCMAPCMGYISREEYRNQINQIISILEGKTEKLKRDLTEEMQIASEKMDYEKAKDLRDKIYAIDNISQKQKVSNISENDIDVIGIARSQVQVCLQIFFIRNSKMIERKNYFFDNLNDETDEEIILDFIKQFYFGKKILPNKIIIKNEIEGRNIIEQVLSETVEHKVEIKVPQKGEKMRLIEMAEKNAQITLENKEKDKYNLLNELKEALGLQKLPRKIEGYDISNLSGTNMVAGMCVLQDGEVKSSLSRRFKIKYVDGQDDPKCMEETITRRLKHSIPTLNESKSNGFGRLPDIILVDGGILQIEAGKRAIKNINKKLKDKINIPVFGIVKNDKHQTRAIIDENKKEIKISDDLLKLITDFQDHIHDTAIEYHQKLRDKGTTKSVLDKIDGIGPKKKMELLRKFGSIKKIEEASVEELENVKGINRELAEKIKRELM